MVEGILLLVFAHLEDPSDDAKRSRRSQIKIPRQYPLGIGHKKYIFAYYM
jgi:hypothetical protein